MSSVTRYRCVTCNTDLGAAGATVESHLVSNPSHSIEEFLFDASRTVANVEGTSRVNNNELFSYDASRGLWLSSARTIIGYGIPTTNQVNVYMRLFGSMTPTTSNMGFYVSRDSTIISLVATRSAGKGEAIMSLRIYGSAIITSITLNGYVYSGSNLVENTNVNAGTFLSCYLTGTAGSDYPQLIVELAERM